VVTEWSSDVGVAATAATTGSPRPLHPEVEVTLLLVAQEALANVAKHAGAARAAVTLSYMDDLVSLDVRDDGMGFEPAGWVHPDGEVGGGFGLTGMRQRVEGIGGTLLVESEPGQGTTIVATVPAPAGPEEQAVHLEVR
jgi:signal transduction histidine kinase